MWNPIWPRRPARGGRPRALLLLLPLSLAVALSCTEATGPSADEDEEDPIASIVVTPSSDTLEIEGSTTLEATVTTAGGVDVTASTSLTWTTTAAAVATVGGSGRTALVQALGAGVATIRAAAAGLTGSAEVTVLTPPPAITTTDLAAGRVDEPYSDTLKVMGGTGTFEWAVAAGSLPPGLSLETTTGVISGTPTAEGSYDLTVEVTSGGRAHSRALTLDVLPPVAEAETWHAVVNVDFMDSVLEAFNDTLVDGAVGAFSTPAGTRWNGADSFTGVTNALDELGVATEVDLVLDGISGGIFIGAATNELQDNGITSAGIPERGFELRGLLPDSAYDLALYVYAEVALSAWTRLDVTHAGETTTLGPNDEPTWTLPGEEGKDYLLLEDVRPYEIEPGVWGLRVDAISEEGAVVGFQLRGPVIAP